MTEQTAAPSAEPRTPAGFFALYPLRIGIAALFIYTGYTKFTDLAGFEAAMDGWGFPAAGLLAPLVAFAELLGGLGILLGVLSRFSSVVLAIVTGTAIVVVKLPGTFFPPGWSIDAVAMAGLVTLAINGPGRPTLSTVLGKRWFDPEELLWSRVRGERRASATGHEAEPTA